MIERRGVLHVRPNGLRASAWCRRPSLFQGLSTSGRMPARSIAGHAMNHSGSCACSSSRSGLRTWTTCSPAPAPQSRRSRATSPHGPRMRRPRPIASRSSRGLILGVPRQSDACQADRPANASAHRLIVRMALQRWPRSRKTHRYCGSIVSTARAHGCSRASARRCCRSRSGAITTAPPGACGRVPRWPPRAGDVRAASRRARARAARPTRGPTADARPSLAVGRPTV